MNGPSQFIGGIQANADIITSGNLVATQVKGYVTVGQQTNSILVGNCATAEGSSTIASEYCAHAEGESTTASGEAAHAEGYDSAASEDGAHAEGGYTVASGVCAHAEGNSTTASGFYSHSEGYCTNAVCRSTHVFGEYNTHNLGSYPDQRGQYVEMVGNGTSSTNLSNARTLDWYGNETLAGNLTYNGGIIGTAKTSDYAECRQMTDFIQPGRVVKENGDGTLSLCQERLSRGCEIISDTYGSVINLTGDINNLPVAIAGRVLAFPDSDPINFEIGAPVCSGVNGTVSQMTEEEERLYPSRIIGTVSEIPTYDSWGSNKEIQINGRIWIRIK